MAILNLLCDSINKISENHFGKTERVFSYELYHIFKHTLEKNNQFVNNIVLDAELPKRRLSDNEARDLGLIDLSVLMSPDIIVHERDTSEYQSLVAEIKIDKSLTRQNLIKDINKLISLKVNYKFQEAVFIFINGDIEKVQRYLNHPEITIQNGANIQIAENTIVIPNGVDISIVSKKSADSELVKSSLLELLQ